MAEETARFFSDCFLWSRLPLSCGTAELQALCSHPVPDPSPRPRPRSRPRPRRPRLRPRRPRLRPRPRPRLRPRLRRSPRSRSNCRRLCSPLSRATCAATCRVSRWLPLVEGAAGAGRKARASAATVPPWRRTAALWARAAPRLQGRGSPGRRVAARGSSGRLGVLLRPTRARLRGLATTGARNTTDCAQGGDSSSLPICDSQEAQPVADAASLSRVHERQLECAHYCPLRCYHPLL